MGKREQDGRRDDARAILDAIRRVVRALRISSRQSEKWFGLSAAQLFVLHKLADTEALSLNELAERTLTHQSSVSVVVQKLVERGLVDRQRSAEDRRSITLSLTASGRAILRKAPDAAQDRLIAAVAKMKPVQRHRLAESLNHLLENAGFAGAAASMLFEEDGRAKGRRYREP